MTKITKAAKLLEGWINPAPYKEKEPILHPGTKYHVMNHVSGKPFSGPHDNKEQAVNSLAKAPESELPKLSIHKHIADHSNNSPEKEPILRPGVRPNASSDNPFKSV